MVATARHRRQDPEAGRAALDGLFEAFRPTLRAATRSCRWPGLTGSDLMQEAAVGLLRAVDSYREGRGPFGPWLWLWARHCCMRAGRAASEHDAALVGCDIWRDLADRSVGDTTVEDAVVDRLELDRRRAAVVGAVDALPADLRSAAYRPASGQIEQRRRVLAMLRHPCRRSLLAALDRVLWMPSVDAVLQGADRFVLDGSADHDRLAAQLAAMETPDPKGVWLDHAACAGMRPEVFFSARAEFRAAAMAACAACPVGRQCLLDALAWPDRGGVRAGTVEKQRRRLRRLVRERRTAVSSPPTVGPGR